MKRQHPPRRRLPKPTSLNLKDQKHVLIGTLLVFGIVGSCLGIWLGLRGKYPQIPNIESVICTLSESHQPCPEVWQMVVNQLLGNPILFSNLTGILELPLQKVGGEIESYQRIWPNQVSITIRPVMISYQIQTGEQLLGVKKNGQISSLFSPSSDFPLVTTDTPVLNDSHLLPWVDQTIQALINSHIDQSLNQTTLAGVDMHLISPVELRLRPQDSQLEYIVDPQEISTDLARLQQLLENNRAANLATLSAEVDLRLRLPVLRRVP